MKINVNFSSNPSLAKNITYFSEHFSSTADYVKNLYPTFPNQFKKLFFKNTELSDKRSFKSYDLNSDSSLDLFIEDEITVQFKSLVLPEPLKMQIMTSKPYTYKSLIKEFQQTKQIEDPIKIHEKALEEADDRKLIWDNGIKNGSVVTVDFCRKNKEKLKEECKAVKTKSKKKKKSKNSTKIKEEKESQISLFSDVFSNLDELDENENDEIINEYVQIIDQQIKPLVDDRKIQRVDELTRKLKEEKVTIIVAGYTSAGKTTFINQLISYFKSKGKGVHQEFLPTDWMENTGFIWILEKSPDEKIRVSAKIKQEILNFEFENEKSFIEKLNCLNEQQKSYFSTISKIFDSKGDLITEFPIITVKLPFFIEGFRIIDCPGYSKKKIFENIKKFINSRIVHIIVIKNLTNPVTIDEYFENFMEEANKTYANLNVFLCITHKDKLKEFYPNPKDQIRQIIPIVRDHIALMERYGVSAKGIYLLNSKDRVGNHSQKRLMKDIRKLFTNYLGYNINYIFSELINVFVDESNPHVDSERVAETREKYERIKILKGTIVANFKQKLSEFLDPLVDVTADEWENWKDDLSHGFTARKNFEDKSAIMNRIINRLQNQIFRYLKENISQMLAESKQKFLVDLQLIVDRKYVSDVLCLSDDNLKEILNLNYKYNRSAYMCLHFQEDYSHLDKYKKLEGFYNKILGLCFWFEGIGLWTSEGAQNELIKHFCRIFELQRPNITEETVNSLNENLMEQCQKFENFRNFIEKYQTAKIIINNLQIKLRKELLTENVEEAKYDLDLLEFRDFELDDSEKGYFIEEKNCKLTEWLNLKNKGGEIINDKL